MWKAEKIELKKNIQDEFYVKTALYLSDCHTLTINGEFIYNALYETLPDWFECDVCTECGVEGCNGSRMLMIKKQGTSLLFLPVFDLMDSFEEYDYDTQTGDRHCPPHKWYRDGILLLEEKYVSQLLSLIPKFKLETIPEISKQEIDLMLEWELMVKKKPSGFMTENFMV